MDIQYNLPAEMEAHLPQLEASRSSFIDIIPVDAMPAQRWHSKFGGEPYLPAGTPFPADEDGRPLFFLAQINFSEIPSFPPFPARGLLQFYISDDDLLGLDEMEGSREQRNWRVLYFEEVLEDNRRLISDFSFLPTYSEGLPMYPGDCYGMSFEMQRDIVPITDHRFDAILGADFFKQFGEREWEVYDEFAQEVSAEGHRIGGYAHFAQEDPRKSDTPWLQLFQMDSDAEMECLWGDLGTAHFFISEADLARRDFSNVMYHWDCH